MKFKDLFFYFKGWIADFTNYNNTFFFSGAFIILSGIMLLFLPLVETVYKKHLIRKKRLKMQKRKNKILRFKLSTNNLNNSSNVATSNASNSNFKHNIIMSTINEIEEQQQQQPERPEQPEKHENEQE